MRSGLRRGSLVFGALAVVFGSTEVLPPRSGASTPGAICADSILAMARDLSGETGVGPPSRVARRPSTLQYAEFLARRLDAVLAPLGGSAWVDPFVPPFTDSPPVPARSVYSNVLGYLPGTRNTPGLHVVGAHLDATAMADNPADPMGDTAPGADDNASGVAAVFEALRVASARGLRPEADLLVSFFDGEERQYVYDETTFVTSDDFLLGSAFVADSVIAARFPGKRVYGMVNLDMVAYNPRQDSLVVLTNASSRWLANSFLDLHNDPENPVAPGLDLSRLVLGLTYSDHASFWNNGTDAVLLIESPNINIHARPHYHKHADTVDNTYSRNGSQVVQAAELLLGLYELWARTGPPALAITGDDILVASAISQDVLQVQVGEALDINVGVTNQGGTTEDAWEVEILAGPLGGPDRRSLGREVVNEVFPPGGRVSVSVPWVPTEDDRGVTEITARVTPPAGSALEGSRTVAVESPEGEIPRAYVYPNPTRDPESAVLRYELSSEGAVRVGVLDLTGREIAVRDWGYDPVLPGPGVRVGLAEVPLADVLQGASLAPGLYLVRVELFDAAGATADVTLSRFVVLR